MQLLSLNVGRPRVLNWHGREIRTAIFKQPVAGPVVLAGVNFAGDAQADLRVHGGPDKAVYAYDATHYAAWRALMPDWTDWTPGLFGENLTTDGLLETAVRVGDVFGVGTARLRAVQPRQPCYKLNVRFDDGSMAARFAQVGRPGIYFRVEAPGTVQAGDVLTLLEAAPTTVTIQDLAQLLTARTVDADHLAEVLALPHLPAEVRRQLTGALSVPPLPAGTALNSNIVCLLWITPATSFFSYFLSRPRGWREIGIGWTIADALAVAGSMVTLSARNRGALRDVAARPTPTGAGACFMQALLGNRGA